MSRYREEAKGALDDRGQGEGDAPWQGVQPQLPPDKVPPGWASDAQNMTFTDLEASQRRGTYCPAGFVADGLTGNQCFGSGLWSDRDGVEWMLIATADGVWRLHDARTPRKIPIPEPLAARVEFVQNGRRMFLYRGEDLVPWIWEGNVFTAWAPFETANLEDGTVPIPNGPSRLGLRPVALPSDRQAVPYDRTRLAISDIGVYHRYDKAAHDYNAPGRTGGEIVAILPFSQSNLLIFNTDSVQVLGGLFGTLATVALGDVNGEIGCVAGGTVAAVGGDAFFLSSTGVYRVRQIVQDRLETAAEAVSEPIRPYMKRINSAAIGQCLAAVHGRYYWLAVPLDGATEPNAILRYDTLTKAWQGIDRFRYWDRAVQIHALHETDFQGQPRLYAVDYNRGAVRVFDYSLAYDHSPPLGESLEPIETRSHRKIEARLVSRGFTQEENEDKRYARGKINLRGWGPNYRATAIFPGVNETQEVVQASAPDRTKWKVFGKADYDPANPDDNHADPDREDYSVDLAETPVDPGLNGIDFDLQQVHGEPFTVRRYGRHLQLEIVNTSGTLGVVSMQVDGNPGRKALRRS